ncbi:unnamed protein product [Tilletia controversa]|nr:unnamed protein product [Tilletia controversa]
MNALAHIVNKVADIKKAQAHLRDADPGVVAAFQDRLAAIRQYKAWLFEHTDNSAPPDLTDAAIARLHAFQYVGSQNPPNALALYDKS